MTIIGDVLTHLKNHSFQNQDLTKKQNTFDKSKVQELTPLIGLDYKYPIIQPQNIQIESTKAQIQKKKEEAFLDWFKHKPPRPKKIEIEIEKRRIQKKKEDMTADWWMRRSPHDMQNMSFDQLSYLYQKPNRICLSYALGVNYKHAHYDKLRDPNGLKYTGVYQGSKINHILCSKFYCERCRNILKKKLRDEVQKALEEHKLYTHFVVTTEGNESYRNRNTYIQSYKDMAKSWNKIRKILSKDAKKQGKHFSYICMFRSQKRGYCHLHVLTNMYIPKKRLQEISALYFNTGFIRVKSNKDTVKYLTNDFLKDHEFYIPFGQRHYSTSRDIKLNVYEEMEEDLADPQMSIHIGLESGRSVVDQVYDQIEHEYGYPPPFDFLLSEFTKIKPKPPPALGGLYINGELKKLCRGGKHD